MPGPCLRRHASRWVKTAPRRLKSLSACAAVCREGISDPFVTTYVDCWSGHRRLEYYDADFGNHSDLGHSEIDALAEYCPDLEAYGSRDNVLGAPLQDGEWGWEFEQEALFIAETLAIGFRALKQWKIYYIPAPLGVPHFDGWEANDDIHRLLANRLYGYFQKACEEYGIECKLDEIILVAQDVIIPNRVFVRSSLPGGMSFTS